MLRTLFLAHTVFRLSSYIRQTDISHVEVSVGRRCHILRLKINIYSITLKKKSSIIWWSSSGNVEQLTNNNNNNNNKKQRNKRIAESVKFNTLLNASVGTAACQTETKTSARTV